MRFAPEPRLALGVPALVRRIGGAQLLALVAAVAIVCVVLAAAFLDGRGREAAVGGAAPGTLGAAPPSPEPLRFRPIAPTEAIAVNAATPVSTLPNPAAKPFTIKTEFELDRSRALECLTAAIYYEAAMEPEDGQRAVAQVVLNRMRHPAYPNSVCGVVYQGAERETGCQFTFTCDGSLGRLPSAEGWKRARGVAWAALNGHVYAPVGWATHYHANYVVPYWSSSLVKLANVGRHIFYRWSGAWGTPPAFRSRYAGAEPEALEVSDLLEEPPLPIDGSTPGIDPLSIPLPEDAAAATAAAERGDFAGAVLRPATPPTAAGVKPPEPAAPPTNYPSALTRGRPPAEPAPKPAPKAAGDEPQSSFLKDVQR